MCSVSAMYDYGRTIPIAQWTQMSWDQYNEIIEKARKWDELMAQPDCHDPMKAAWVREVEARLEKLEADSLKN